MGIPQPTEYKLTVDSVTKMMYQLEGMWVDFSDIVLAHLDKDGTVIMYLRGGEKKTMSHKHFTRLYELQ